MVGVKTSLIAQIESFLYIFYIFFFIKLIFFHSIPISFYIMFEKRYLGSQ